MARDVVILFFSIQSSQEVFHPAMRIAICETSLSDRQICHLFAGSVAGSLTSPVTNPVPVLAQALLLTIVLSQSQPVL
jgi:hypothetical protein